MKSAWSQKWTRDLHEMIVRHSTSVDMHKKVFIGLRAVFWSMYIALKVRQSTTDSVSSLVTNNCTILFDMGTLPNQVEHTHLPMA